MGADTTGLEFLVSREAQHAFLAHLAAAASLHNYNGGEVKRRSAYGRAQSNDYGRIYQEKVTFTDGAVRIGTFAEPKPGRLTSTEISPFVISATDALGTGPDGFNADVIEKLMARGFPVVWLHHQGRESKLSLLPRFLWHKSVGRSAHHQHNLLDDLAPHGNFDSRRIISIGDSRGAMTGEAVDALARLYGREVIWSDYIAGCFEHLPHPDELPALIASLFHEPMALGRLAMRKLAEANGDVVAVLKRFGKTFDPHPLNLLHESAWILPLMSGDAGRYADAVSLDRDGARTYLAGDAWSTGGRAWKDKHSIRPGIYYFLEQALPDGAIPRHLDLADTFIQEKRLDRLSRLLEELVEHDFLAETVDFHYVATGHHATLQAA